MTAKKKAAATPIAPKKHAAARRAKPAANCAECPVRHRQQRLINNLVEEVGNHLTADKGKASVGDYIRLLQIQKDMEEGLTREIRVTWVEQPKESESVK
jgi:transposase-like protein